MPVYTYRREDGTTFDLRQKFSDDPLTVDPATGQRVSRVIQAPGIVFKGSGFYVNDSKGSKTNLSTPAASSDNGSAPAATNGTGADKGKEDSSKKEEPKKSEPAAD